MTKTRSNRVKEETSVELTKRSMTWDFIAVFFLGSIYSAIAGEPISNFLFYMRLSTGVPLTSVEQIFYNNYLPFIVYAIIFGTVVLLASFTKLKPMYFMYFFVGYAAAAMFMAYYVMKFDIIAMILLTVPFLVIIYMIFWQTNIHLNGKQLAA